MRLIGVVPATTGKAGSQSVSTTLGVLHEVCYVFVLYYYYYHYCKSRCTLASWAAQTRRRWAATSWWCSAGSASTPRCDWTISFLWKRKILGYFYVTNYTTHRESSVMMDVGFTMKISFCFENPRKWLKYICLHVCFGRCVDLRLVQNIISHFCTYFPKNLFFAKIDAKKLILRSQCWSKFK